MRPPFPSDTREKRGKFVGIAEHVGHVMTFRILSDDTRQIIDRSLVRPVTDDAPNQRADMAIPPDSSTNPTEYVQSKVDSPLKLVEYSDLTAAMADLPSG